MKKITLVSAVAAAAFAATAAFSATNVFAADGDTTGSTANINLTPSTEAGKTGVTLDAAPSFNFGQTEISTSTQNYTIGGDNDQKDAGITGNLKVTNNGTDDAWSVSVKAAPFTDGNKTLKGAVLTLNAGTASAAEADNQSTAPTTADATLDFSKDSASTDGIFTATSGNGVGTWLSTYTKANLEVPAGNVSGTYTSSLTWTLSDTPTDTPAATQNN